MWGQEGGMGRGWKGKRGGEVGKGKETTGGAFRHI